MHLVFHTQTNFWKITIACLMAAVFWALTPRQANAQESGNFCVQDYAANSNCTAQDVRIKELRIVEVVKPCYVEPVGYLDVIFEALVSSEKSPDRYDIGMFLALNGGSALSGDFCYHDYLPPPLTTTPIYGDKNGDGVPDIDNGPWWDGENWPTDTCGDIQTNTQIFHKTEKIRIACTDIDSNGAADIHVCTSWDNQVKTGCTTVKDAFPGTPAKCGCSVINFDFTPTAIHGVTFSASNEAISPKLVLTALGLLLLCGLSVGYFRQRWHTENITS